MQQHNYVLLAVVSFLSLWFCSIKLESDAQRKLYELSEDWLSEEHRKRDLKLASFFHHTHHEGREAELQQQIRIMQISRREMQDKNQSAINQFYRQLKVHLSRNSSEQLQAFVNGHNWGELAYQVTYRELYAAENKYLGLAMAALQHARIVKAEPATGGSQLKVQVTLQGGTLAYFKPKWFDRDFTILGEVFAGEDRHNGKFDCLYYVARSIQLFPAGDLWHAISAAVLRRGFHFFHNTFTYRIASYKRMKDLSSDFLRKK